MKLSKDALGYSTTLNSSISAILAASFIAVFKSPKLSIKPIFNACFPDQTLPWAIDSTSSKLKFLPSDTFDLNDS